LERKQTWIISQSKKMRRKLGNSKASKRKTTIVVSEHRKCISG
jgi:hypothetical protein